MNWSNVLNLEPRLIRAERIAADAFVDGLDWATFWSQVAPELTRLVGPLATCPELRSTLAYTVALRHCTTVLARGTGADAWRSPRPWDGVTVVWHVDPAAEVVTV